VLTQTLGQGYFGENYSKKGKRKFVFFNVKGLHSALFRLQELKNTVNL